MSDLTDERAGWPSALTDAAAEIRDALASAEPEFLAIGSRLCAIQAHASAALQAASTAADAVAGPGTLDARQQLSCLADRLEAHFRAAHDGLDEAGAALRAIVPQLAGVTNGVAEFENIVRTLRIVVVSTKVESARISAAESGFDALSASMAELAQRIHDRLQAIGVCGRHLVAGLASARELLRRAEEQRRSAAAAAVARTRESVELLGATLARGSRATVAVAEASQAIARDVAAVVESLQYHDITRQELEHVETALAELAAELASGTAPDATGVARLTALQQGQVERAVRTLTEALNAVGGHLRDVAERSAGLSDTAAEALGLLDGPGDSTLAEVDGLLSTALGLLERSTATTRTLADALRRVADGAAEMARFAAQIEEVGGEIQLVALNAAVKAAHTGARGAAMGVLAGRLSTLSAETQEQIGAVVRGLHGLVASATGLRESLDARLALATRADAGTPGIALRSGVARIAEVNAGAATALQSMQHGAVAMAREIAATVRGTAIHERFEEAARRSRRILEPILREAERAGATGAAGVAGTEGVVLPPSATGHARRLARRYTTAAERRYHSEAHGELAPPVAAAASGSELGDNVEIF